MLETAQRATEVVATLVRFGFGEVVLRTGLAKFLGHRDKDAADEQRDERPLPVRVRLLLEELGPTFIKTGQILSTRADLVPPDWIEELRKLQSDVPPEPWDGDDGIHAVLQNELGDELESAFEFVEPEAMAAASIAQVHRGKLKSGERVVLKVLRPGIRVEMAADLELMRLFARLTRSHFQNLGFDPQAVIDEFARQLARETDLLVEARSTSRMRRDFEEHDGVVFAKVYDDLSTSSVLVMEQIDGTLLNRLDVASLSQERREAIIRNGADVVFRQCLVIGFFHADPHPGNIIELGDGRLCFVDCGMTGLVDPGTVMQLAQITHGALDGNLDLVVKMAIDISEADPRMADDRQLRQDAWHFVDRFHEGTLESIHMGRLLDEFFTILRRHRLRCPADIVYLIKALTTIEGVAEEIAPEFDLVSYVKPYVENLIKQRYSVGGIRKRVQEAMVSYADLIEDLPSEVSDLLRAVRQNQLSLPLEHRGLDRLTTEMERASMNVSWSLVISSLIVGAAILVLADHMAGKTTALTWIALAGLIVGAIFGVWRLIRSRWSNR